MFVNCILIKNKKKNDCYFKKKTIKIKITKIKNINQLKNNVF